MNKRWMGASRESGATLASAVAPLVGPRAYSVPPLGSSVGNESLIGIGQTGFKSSCETGSSLPFPESLFHS